MYFGNSPASSPQSGSYIGQAPTIGQNVVYVYTATSGQTVFSGQDAQLKTLTYAAGLEDVYLNGIRLVRSSDYTASDGTSVTLTKSVSSGDVLVVVAHGYVNLANTYTKAEVYAKTETYAKTDIDSDFRLLNHGQCRFTKQSGGTLGLYPFNGNKIIINGSVCTIPSAGVPMPTLSGMTTNTAYNVFVYMNGSTMTLEVSSTASATDPTTGIVIKSGDATRTLVGSCVAAGATSLIGDSFGNGIDSLTNISWFNRRWYTLTHAATTGVNVTNAGTNCSASPSYVNVWADDGRAFATISATLSGFVRVDTQNAQGYTYWVVNGTAYSSYGTGGSAPIASAFVPTMATYSATTLSAGLVYFTISSNVSTGTGQYYQGRGFINTWG